MQTWYIKTDQGEVGPIKTSQLKQMAKLGQVTEQTLVRLSDRPKFIRARQVRGLLQESKADPVPQDSVPQDSVPQDSVPQDSVPQDSVPQDSGQQKTESKQSDLSQTSAPSETPSADSQPPLQLSAQSLRLQAEIKKLEWGGLPKAKLNLGRVAYQHEIFLPESKPVVQRCANLIQSMEQLRADEPKPPPTGHLAQDAKEAAVHFSKSAKKRAQIEILQKRLRSEFVQLANVILASDQTVSSTEVSEDFSNCREIQERLKKLKETLARDAMESYKPAEHKSAVGGSTRLGWLTNKSIAAPIAVLACVACLLFVGVRWWRSGDTSVANLDNETSATETLRIDDSIADSISNPLATNASKGASNRSRIAPPTGLPSSLSPIAVPTLVKSSLPESAAAKTLSARPVSPFAIPQSFSGVLRFGNPVNINLGVDLVFEEIADEPLPPRYTNEKQEKYLQRTLDSVKKRGGQHLSGYLVSRLPESYSGAARSVSGKIRVYQIRDPDLPENDRNYIEQPRKEIDDGEFSGWADPQFGLVAIRVNRWNKMQERIVINYLRDISLSGYWMPEQKQFSGWAGSAWNHFFLGADPEQANGLLFQTIELQRSPSQAENREIQLYRLSLKSRGVPTRKFEQLQQESMIIDQWFADWERELSEDPYRKCSSGDVYHRGISLFATDRFQKAFGKPIEALTHFDRSKLIQMFRESDKRRPKRDPQKGFDYRDSLIDELDDGLNGMSYPQLVFCAGNFRARIQWLKQHVSQLSSAGPYEDAVWDQFKIEPWQSLALEGWLKEDKAEFESELTRIQTEQALSQLAAFDRIPESAREKKDFERIAELVPKERAEESLERLVTLRQAGLESQLVDSFGELVATNDDRDSIQWIASWIREFHKRFGELREKECFRLAKQYAIERHRRLIDAYLPDIIYQFDVATNDQECRDIKNAAIAFGYGSIESNQESVDEAFERNLDRIDLQNRLRFYSPQEREWMVAGSTRVQIPEVVPEPTAESIRIAMYREAGNQPGSTWDTPERVSVSLPGIGSLINQVTGMDTSVGLGVREIQKVMNPQGQTAVSKDDGFLCYYRLEIKLNTPQLAPSDDPRQQFIGGLNELAAKSASHRTMADVFVLTQNGWRSPTIRRRGIEGLVKAVSALGEGLENAGAGMSGWRVWPGTGKSGQIRRVRVGRKIFNRYVPSN